MTTHSYFVLLVALAAACGGNASVEDPPASSGGGGQTSGPGGGGQGGSAGGQAGGGQGGEGGVQQCGGFARVNCPEGYFCDYEPSYCGGDDSPGVCTPKPVGCDDNLDPTCACDGQVYSNACEAAVAGFDESLYNYCTPPEQTFGCGSGFCSLDLEYCQIQYSDVGGEPNSYACLPLPMDCGQAPSCACLANEVCGEYCEGDASVGLSLGCPGG